MELPYLPGGFSESRPMKENVLLFVRLSYRFFSLFHRCHKVSALLLSFFFFRKLWFNMIANPYRKKKEQTGSSYYRKRTNGDSRYFNTDFITISDSGNLHFELVPFDYGPSDSDEDNGEIGTTSPEDAIPLAYPRSYIDSNCMESSIAENSITGVGDPNSNELWTRMNILEEGGNQFVDLAYQMLSGNYHHLHGITSNNPIAIETNINNEENVGGGLPTYENISNNITNYNDSEKGGDIADSHCDQSCLTETSTDDRDISMEVPSMSTVPKQRNTDIISLNPNHRFDAGDVVVVAGLFDDVDDNELGIILTIYHPGELVEGVRVDVDTYMIQIEDKLPVYCSKEQLKSVTTVTYDDYFNDKVSRFQFCERIKAESFRKDVEGIHLAIHDLVFKIDSLYADSYLPEDLKEVGEMLRRVLGMDIPVHQYQSQYHEL